MRDFRGINKKSVSRGTHTFSNRLSLLLLLGGLAINGRSSLVFATPLGDAQSNAADATNKYYETVYAKPGMSREEKLKLYNQTIAPAQQKMGEAFNQTLKDSEAKIFAPGRAAAASGKKAGAAGAKGKSGPAKKGAVPDTGPSKPEVVLDGSGIPKEIEFKGKAKAQSKTPTKMAAKAVKKTAPAPMPVVAPTLMPYSKAIPVPSGGVDEVDFSAHPKNTVPIPAPSKK